MPKQVTSEERDYIKLIAIEAAQTAIEHALGNGFMPKLREEARGEVTKELEIHLKACPAVKHAERSNFWTVTIACLLLGALFTSGFALMERSFHAKRLDQQEIESIVINAIHKELKLER